jgi:CMP/dCMP kinase
VAHVLGGLLGLDVVSTGSIQRRLAQERGMTTLEFNLHSEANPGLDDLIDGHLIALQDSTQEVIVDSRMAWFFLPESLKVYLIVDPIIGTSRVLSDNHRVATESYADQERAYEEIRRRQESEKKRFLSKYGVDYTRFANYDLVVDTSHVTPQEVAEQILARSPRPAGRPEIWMCPQRLYPTQDGRGLSGEAARSATDSIRAIAPVDVIRINDNFFIYDGHKRVSAALQAGLPFVLVRIVANQGDEITPHLLADDYVKNECNLSSLSDWEDCHRFRFPGYPLECSGNEGAGLS